MYQAITLGLFLLILIFFFFIVPEKRLKRRIDLLVKLLREYKK